MYIRTYTAINYVTMYMYYKHINLAMHIDFAYFVKSI